MALNILLGVPYADVALVDLDDPLRLSDLKSASETDWLCMASPIGGRCSWLEKYGETGEGEGALLESGERAIGGSGSRYWGASTVLGPREGEGGEEVIGGGSV